jgi:Transcriptional regulatory protein, C terminal
MTTALPSVTPPPSAHRLRAATAPAPPGEPAGPPRSCAQAPPGAREGGGAARFVAYLVVLPADVDPGALFAGAGLHPTIHAVVLDDGALAAPVPDPAPPVPPHPRADALLADGTLVVDTARRVAEVEGVGIELTYLEFALLARLMERPGQVHSREQLVRQVWGYEHVGDGRTVDVHIARIRRKLGAGHRASIVTVRRVGYKYLPRQG